MQPLNRRQFVHAAAAATLPASLLAREPEKVSEFSLAPFRFDVTPPMGHSLCGGWIKPVEAVDDPLEAVGFVLSGAGKPVVVCAVDWTGLLNEAHVRWRTALAEAAGTTPDRVAVQCVHQHNAPFACLDAERIVAAQGDLPDIVEVDFFKRCLDRGRAAVRAGLKKARRVTHVASGKGRVEKVASNRRVSRDDKGKVLKMRGSSCRDAALRALPEGLIDPWLRTVSFYDRDTKLAACHYYATHPMSYYGDGRVSSDFAGLARKRRQRDEPECLHVYFTGCAGNIAAGKYNDGSKKTREVLTGRVYQGMLAAEKEPTREPVEKVRWRTVEVLPPPHPDFSAGTLAKEISDKERRVVQRNRPSYRLAWIRRTQAKKPPILLSALHLNDISLLHLPAESFIQYQLRAQEAAPDRFVATAAYGDGGPWYIPVREEYSRGGYEVSVAFCAPEVDPLLTNGCRELLKG